MIVNDDFPIQIIEKEFTRRRMKNTSYSLRSFAKDLGINSSNLSAILKRKRGVPSTKADYIAKKLSLRPREEKLFNQSIQRKRFRKAQLTLKQTEKEILNEELHYSLLSEWEYFGVLKLIELENAPRTFEEVASRLNISIGRATSVLNNLIDLSFIEFKEDEGFKRLIKELDTSDDEESSALKRGNLEALELAMKALELPVEARDFGIVTFGIDPSRMDEFKGIIREFQEKLFQFAEYGPKKEVYQFTTQLIPLSKYQENI